MDGVVQGVQRCAGAHRGGGLLHPFFGPATTAIVASLPRVRDKQGVASAVNDISRELGGALGIAVLGSIF